MLFGTFPERDRDSLPIRYIASQFTVSLRTKPTAIDAATQAAVRLLKHRQPSPFISSGPSATTYVELLQHKKKTIGVTRNLTNSLERMI